MRTCRPPSRYEPPTAAARSAASCACTPGDPGRETIAAAQVAPLLVVASGGRSSDGQTYTEGVAVVENVGGGPAQGVVVISSWGNAPLSIPVLRPGARAEAKVRISLDEWKQHKLDGAPDPEWVRVRYQDARGETHEEAVRGAINRQGLTDR